MNVRDNRIPIGESSPFRTANNSLLDCGDGRVCLF